MQPDISPLAKRLAEENNVEWQSLDGSGSDGRIVERDVLEYLARVMAGEEDLNPTPEPLPAGMNAWPEEASADGATGARSVQSSAQTVPSAEDISAELTADEPLLDIDTRFDDAPTAPGTPRVEMKPSATPASELEDDVSDDIFLFDDDFSNDFSNEAGDHESGDSEAVTDRAVTDRAVTDRAMPGESFAFDSDEAPDDPPTDLAGMAAETPETPAAPGFSFDADFGAEADTQSAASGTLNSRELQDGLTDTDSDDDLELFTVTAAEAPNLPDTQDVALFADSSASGGDTESDLSLFLTDVEDDTVADEALANDTLTSDEFTAADASADAAETSPENPAETAPRQVSEDGETDLGVPSVSAAAKLGSGDRGTPTSAAPLQLVSYGLLLRRHVDLTRLMQVQVAIGQELGAGPVGPSSLLLRAAAKALATAPLNDHREVGLAVFGDRAVQVAAVPGVLTRPFKELAAAQPDTAAGRESAFGVIVADMSELDIDEAVLNAGAPVLTLGRVLHDSSEGAHHSTLSLSGHLTVEQGTKFLAAVAELLDSPIRLVV